ncbi:hypothetical protein PR003_g3589 [Phytophthora rubi]|uniref:Amino acid transporter transmembrane domain-containing protein n=1 Tax=Phytophthora rubi TaxID=129364 RepID=A0A6A4FV30_9STRA|nr:hypothetical protein PR002_g3575 [Phytophthora rubi]KAE9047549.1 hypothetical protein PR001_g4167 [Phytophthora rubi]KAE9353989.1 hypothetical protein PR003_g3589 [Phytophthora rubi]
MIIYILLICILYNNSLCNIVCIVTYNALITNNHQNTQGPVLIIDFFSTVIGIVYVSSNVLMVVTPARSGEGSTYSDHVVGISMTTWK